MSDAWMDAHNERCAIHDAAEARKVKAHQDEVIARSRRNNLAKAAAKIPKVVDKPVRAQEKLDRIFARLGFERQSMTQAAAGMAEAGIKSASRLDFDLTDGTDNVSTETEVTILSTLRANPDAKEIFLRINSRGGWARSAQNIFCGLHAHPARKTALVLDQCCSGAVLILMGCHHRYALPSSQFLVHCTTSEDNGPHARMENLACDFFEVEVAKLCHGIDPERFKALRAEGCTFDATEALALKLITGIVDDEQAAEEENVKIEICDRYQIQTIGGDVYDLPLDPTKIIAIANAMQHSPSAFLGLPSIYRTMAARFSSIASEP